MDYPEAEGRAFGSITATESKPGTPITEPVSMAQWSGVAYVPGGNARRL
jgi:hypothetical protein